MESIKKKILIEKLERVQKFFTRIIIKKCNMEYINYDERLKLFNLEKLSHRRAVNDLVNLFKIIKGYTHLNPEEDPCSSYTASKHRIQSKKHCFCFMHNT